MNDANSQLSIICLHHYHFYTVTLLHCHTTHTICSLIYALTFLYLLYLSTILTRLDPIPDRTSKVSTRWESTSIQRLYPDETSTTPASYLSHRWEVYFSSTQPGNWTTTYPTMSELFFFTSSGYTAKSDQSSSWSARKPLKKCNLTSTNQSIQFSTPSKT